MARQGRGAIRLPASDIASIDAAPAPARPPAAAVLGGTAAPPADATLPDDQKVADLKRRMADYPLARATNRLQLVALLDRLGQEALQRRQAEEARRRFEDALVWSPDDRNAHLGLAAARLAEGDAGAAREVLEPMRLAHAADPDVQILYGEAAARQGRAADALAAWEAADLLRPDPALRRRIDELRRHDSVEKDYRRDEAARFTLSYDGGRTTDDLEREIVAELDGMFPGLSRQFDYQPPRPIAVVVYPERDFYEATRASPDVAGLYDGTVRVPCGGLRHLGEDGRAVLRHEMAHAFIAGKSASGAPRWLHEGLAQIVEGRKSDAFAERALAREFRAAGGGAWGAGFSYPSALSFTEYLVARYGWGSLNAALDAMGGGLDSDAALLKATGYDRRDLQRQWGEDLASRRLP